MVKALYLRILLALTIWAVLVAVAAALDVI